MKRKVLNRWGYFSGGELEVNEEPGVGLQLVVDGVTQSGGAYKQVWRPVLDWLENELEPKRVLVLGLGGGSLVAMLKEIWGDVEITAVEIDEGVVQVFEKGLFCDTTNVEVVVADAVGVVDKFVDGGRKWDLVFVDVFEGSRAPEEIEEVGFVKQVDSVLSDDGVVVWTRLLFGDSVGRNGVVRNRLEKVFGSLETVVSRSNVFYLTRRVGRWGNRARG